MKICTCGHTAATHSKIGTGICWVFGCRCKKFVLDKEVNKMPITTKEHIRELVAAAAHAAWSGWTKYMFNKVTYNPDGSATIPADLVRRWTRQMNTSYSELPESEKESDRVEADRYLQAINSEGEK